MNSNAIGNKDKVCRFNAKQKGIQPASIRTDVHIFAILYYSLKEASVTGIWIQLWIKVKTSCFIETKKNKLNLKSGNPKITRAHSPLYMKLSFSLNKNAWQGTGKIPKRIAMKKERKAKEKEKNPIRNQSKRKKTQVLGFFSDINQSSKSYCQEQLRASSAHVQPDWFICFRFLSYFLSKVGLETLGRRVSNESKTTLCLLGSSILNESQEIKAFTKWVMVFKCVSTAGK